MKGGHMDDEIKRRWAKAVIDEHSPYWQPPQTKTVDFLSAVLRGVLFAVAVAMFLTLLGCTTIDPENRVQGWPQLTVVEHYVPAAQMRARCDRYAGAFMLPLACAEFFLDRGECHLWFDENPHPSVVQHERMHCLGYGHPGDDTMHKIFADWKSRAAH